MALPRKRLYRILVYIRDRLDWFFMAVILILFLVCLVVINSTIGFTIWNIAGSFAVSLLVAWLLSRLVISQEDAIYHERLRATKEAENCIEGGEGAYERAEFSDANPRPVPDTASDNDVIKAIDRVKKRRKDNK